MKLFQGSRKELAALVFAIVVVGGISYSRAEVAKPIEIENEYVKYVIGADGSNVGFIDKKSGKDYCDHKTVEKFSKISKDGKRYAATKAAYADNKITIEFADSNVSAVIGVKTDKHYLTFEVLSVSDKSIDELVIIDVPLTSAGSLEDEFQSCTLALNLQTNVNGIPGPSQRLGAACYKRFDFAGTKAAILGCPKGELRNTMKEAVSSSKDIPQTNIGGPWAMDAEINQGSYVLNTSGMTEKNIGEWIELCQSLGLNQIDFHMGTTFRFGDLEPDKTMYPNGYADFKVLVDKLHAAGIKAGLHTYAFFIAKNSMWVTPVPDKRLGKDATFTLAEAMTAEVNSVPVIESTEKMHTTTGFFIQNSITLRIDNELINYSDVKKDAPYAFTKCTRGAFGTKVSTHEKGAKIYHLKEMFGLFTPEADSTMLAEVAAKTAEAYNKCDFDMIYLDALDGGGILAGGQNEWHYGGKFVYEICKRLEKPALMEMSTFYHQLWFMRSRMGAWDVPTRSRKTFVDLHCEANKDTKRMFLPSNLGWWSLGKHWGGPQGDNNFMDDIEYLCGKCIANDSSLSFIVSPETIKGKAYLEKLAATIKQYETLRHQGYFPEAIKKKLEVKGAEFTLEKNKEGKPQLREASYTKHKVNVIDGDSNVWKTNNKYGKQPLKIRIEALMSGAPYDQPNNIVLADFNNPADFNDRKTANGITAELTTSTQQVKVGPVSGYYSAANTNATRAGSWTKMAKTFTQPIDMTNHQGIGVWIYGDGKGELLNFQIQSPSHISTAIGERYLVVDFKGWKYFELVETDSDEFANYKWPYGQGHSYQIYFFSIFYNSIGSLSIWYNNIPANDKVECYISPVKAIPLVKAKLKNPSVTIGGKTITFPVDIESECFLEFISMDDCKVYDVGGKLLAEVKPQGDVPALDAGENQIKFDCGVEGNVRPRARVTVMSTGEVLNAK